jgi:N-acetylmuramoyl-L-alanine amidase
MSDTDSFNDQQLFAKVLWGEARGESYKGQQAVASVVMNRVNQPRWWGHDIRSVLTKPYQFSCLNQSDPNRPKLLEVGEEDGTYRQCYFIAGIAIAGTLIDVTGGATSYCTLETNPNWSIGLTPTIIIGHHKFYMID